MRILVKWPTRSRPGAFFQTLGQWRDYLSGKHEVEFVISGDTDDQTMFNPGVITQLDAIPNLKYRFGNSKTKVQACNADMEIADSRWDIVILASDDMIPVIRGYDDRIAIDMAANYPNLDGCLWYFDNRQRTLNTLSILGRAYYDRLGYIYHPDFISLYCDDYHQALAASDNKIAMFTDCIIAHAWGAEYIGWDNLYARNSTPEIIARDKQTFERLLCQIT